MDLLLKDKVAIITGSAQGIGEAIARALAAEGVQVSLCDVNAAKGEAVRKSLETSGTKAIFSTIDLGKTKQINDLVEKTMKTFGRIDILVNNAGICPRSPLEDLAEEEWDKVLTVNLKGTFFLSQSVFKIMKEQKYGRIVNLASMTIRVGGITVGAHYTASKGGVQALTKAFARNGAQYNITANALAPGFIATEIYAHYNEEQLLAVRKQIPLGYLGTPEDVANLAVFLASDRARYITGVTYDINGGVVMW
jgi:3-oxoacyl-[acyl-carrier protein] reductase